MCHVCQLLTVGNVAITNVFHAVGAAAGDVGNFLPLELCYKTQGKYLPGLAVRDLGTIKLELHPLLHSLLNFSMNDRLEVGYLNGTTLKHVLMIWTFRHTVMFRRPGTRQVGPKLREPFSVELDFLV